MFWNNFIFILYKIAIYINNVNWNYWMSYNFKNFYKNDC